MTQREKRLKAVRRLEAVEIVLDQPCPARWQDMEGDDTVRRCHSCNLNVYNFAKMTPAEILDTIDRYEGKLCAQLYIRADGTTTLERCNDREHMMLRGRIVVQSR